ncbi:MULTISPECIES: hypothetical protein [unclassified Acinetobacter]|uniref:hypothetical protein n=1 Tax=unclassified Acinetobacter TaxID=196816 RepID=UPI0022EB372B|nr:MULTISPECIES: hypothetical protein [unclassified Acinetobacter]MDA3449191.1 hypothetical protein [Acinetobacter sp. AOR40_HL]MDA3456752.1 hypothetical protein [Acinetobacter sp. AOR39_HL]
MDNYKIKVKDEAESKEAQELFFGLGVSRPDGTKNTYLSPTVFGLLVVDGLLSCVFAESVFYDSKAKELTLPQLRDLVVLKRNDVKDATHIHMGDAIYRSVNGFFYGFRENLGRWVFLQHMTDDDEDLELVIRKSKPQDPALISGADVPALINAGKEVQFRSVFNVQGGGDWQDLDLERDEEEFSLGDLINTRFEWRLKPQTIKLELELPKPFEPKDGQRYFYLNPHADAGYGVNTTTKWNKYLQFGAWRTEEEIKQVVEHLRKIRGTNS